MLLPDKIQLILADRRPYPWGEALGFHKGTVAKMVKQGSPPGPEFLSIISRVENVSITWLLTGEGSPFMATVFASDAEAEYLLDMHLTDEPGWDLYLIGCAGEHAIVLAQPGEITLKERQPISYTIVEVLVGAIGPRTLHRAAEHPQLWQLDLPPETFQALRAGQLGTYALFGSGQGEGAASGLLTAAKRLTSRRVAESGAVYGLTDNNLAAQAAEARLLDAWRALAPEEQQSVLHICQTLAEKKS